MKIAIIGGGLAGLSLSILCAKQGMKVQLFEKKKYPFHKVCGEYIAMESWSFLQRIGVPLSSMDLPRIDELVVSAPNGNQLLQKMTTGGFGVSRYTLDRLLAEIAREAGVEVHEQTAVQALETTSEKAIISTPRDTYEVDIACGAFGKRANLDVQLKRAFLQKTQRQARHYIGVKYHIQVDGFPTNRIELHNFKDGYCGISKVEGNRYCLCYLTTAQNLRTYNNDIKEMERQVLYRNPYLKDYFERSTFLYEKPLAISNISFVPKTTQEKHLLLLGDAAGLITPLCGNGMSMAMHSAALLGELLAHFAAKKIDRSTLEKVYQTTWQQQFRTRLKAGRLLQSLFGKEWTTNWVINSLRPFPGVVRKLITLTHGSPF
ncbi:MAG: NAD(P)/FAD-dependent oxidoreductase [Thermonemataceae bacterium]